MAVKSRKETAQIAFFYTPFIHCVIKQNTCQLVGHRSMSTNEEKKSRLYILF